MTDTIYIEGSGQEGDVKIDLWLKDLLVRTPGALRAVVRREFILAAREFFVESLCWRAHVGPKNVLAGKKRYYLSPYDAYSDVCHVFAVGYNGTQLRSYAAMPGYTEPEMSSPLGWYIEGADTIRLWPAPNQAHAKILVAYVALQPKMTVRNLPREAATHFYDALLDGALGRLYTHPAKAYSDPTRAAYHLKRFRDAIGKYNGRAKTKTTPSWTFPRFGK